MFSILHCLDIRHPPVAFDLHIYSMIAQLCNPSEIVVSKGFVANTSSPAFAFVHSKHFEARLT